MHKKMKDSPLKSGRSDSPDPDHRSHPQRFGYDRDCLVTEVDGLSRTAHINERNHELRASSCFKFSFHQRSLSGVVIPALRFEAIAGEVP
jgi:hypothetical protein